MKSPQLWMGLRYLFTRTSGYSSIVNWVSVIGLALGLMLLIVIASINNGLHEEMQQRLFNVVPHAFLQDPVEVESFAKLRADPRVASVEPFFQGVGMISYGNTAFGLNLMGVTTGADQLNEAVVEGDSASFGEGGIALASSFSHDIGVEVGEEIVLTMTEPVPGGIRTFVATYTLIATFSFGSALDYTLALLDYEDLKQSGFLKAGVSGWRITMQDPFDADKVLAEYPHAEVWTDQFRELFLSFKLEKLVLYVLMSLVIALASFNIISGQAMLINIKRADIAILQTLGADRSLIHRVFAIQGSCVAFTGIVIGIVLGVLLAGYSSELFWFIEYSFGIDLLQDTLFTAIPSQIHVVDVLGGALIAVLLCSYAIWKPVASAVKQSPVQSLNMHA